jgi:hypothetical protein
MNQKLMSMGLGQNDDDPIFRKLSAEFQALLSLDNMAKMETAKAKNDYG